MMYFTPAETACKCGCGMNINPKLLGIANAVRQEIGLPMGVTSGARCQTYNKKVGGKANSAHTRGLALDISVQSGSYRMALIKALLKNGVRRIGIAKTFVHFDIDDSLPQDVIFDY